jgi:hypothetical protein
MAGAHSNHGYRMWDVLTGRVQHINASDLYAVNSHHSGSQNHLDRFETYGGTGSGATTGHRYVIFNRANEDSATRKVLVGLRLGPSDRGKVPPVGRVICAHRSFKPTFSSSNQHEAHFQPSRDMRYVVFASNWGQEPCTGGTEQVHAYVVEIPDGWKSPNNSGL